MQKELEAILRKAGNIILSAGSHYQVTCKPGDANFVTEYDIKVQDYLKTALANFLPEAAFVGEEDTLHSEQTGLRWVVDPIDGTTNFMHGMGQSCVSVALCEGTASLIGAVYQPYRRELFVAQAGRGATLNGEKLVVSTRPLSESIIAFGTTPYDKSLAPRTFSVLEKLFPHCADLRRSGCAAQDMCYVAAGRYEGFFELRLSPWDFAAGMLIAAESGAWVSDIEGKPLKTSRPSSVICSTHTAAPLLLENLKKQI